MERKEAIEVIKKNWPDSSFTMLREALETLIPEFKESEDETIRKDILAFIKNNAVGEHNWHKWLAWLEKQGEQKSIDSLTQQEAMDIAVAKCFNDQKPAGKIEPKFKVGDWITDGNITIQIKAIENDCYLYCGDCVLYSTKTADKVYHIWTIEDAKDGDILAIEPLKDYPSPFIAIYKERGLDYFNSHCFISFDAKFYTGDTGHDVTGIHPATKEQRDLLFKKMYEAGYEWDSEKKELKKIEQNKPTDKKASLTDVEKSILNFADYFHINRCKPESEWVDEIKMLRDYIPSRILKSTEWSEEDEEMLNLIIARLHSHRNVDLEEYGKEYDWLNYNLKSLRYQKQWKPTEEQMKALHNLNLTGGISYAGQGQELINLYNELKRLK